MGQGEGTDMSQLSMLAFLMVACFMALIMTRRASPLVALILVPTAFAIVAGYGAGLGPMMLEGVRTLAPTGVMLLFAILYFGLMIDVGLFEPLIALIVRIVGTDPQRVLIGTALLALLVSLDGDGTTTYMITIAAFLPLYHRLGLDKLKLTCVVIMSSAVMNLLPWGGPTARAATALKLDPTALFHALIPAMVALIAWVLFVAWVFGRAERRRLGWRRLEGATGDVPPAAPSMAVAALEQAPLHGATPPAPTPIAVFNLALTLVLIVTLIAGVLPIPVLFMLAFAVALLVNRPTVEAQRVQIAAHAGNALAVAGVIFAAGVFTGILSGTHMVDAMATSVTSAVPPSLGPYLAPITALISIPFTFLISNDAFYFGILPILATTGASYGVSAKVMACASLVGQQVHLLSPLVPSTYLLVGMAGVELGDHQRYTLRWALASCLVMAMALATTGLMGS